MPSVGSLVRARWSHLLEGSPRLSTALSPESIIDDLIVVGGPIAVAMFGTEVDPAAGRGACSQARGLSMGSSD